MSFTKLKFSYILIVVAIIMLSISVKRLVVIEI